MKLLLKIVLSIAGGILLLTTNVAAQSRFNGKIAFNEVQPFGDSQIFIANTDGSGIIQLPSPTSCLKNEKPKWSPDGTRFVFSSNCDGNGMQIYSENPDGTNRLRLTNNPPATDDSPVWSPDGRTIAFVSSRDFGQFHIYLMNADGTNQHRLTNSIGIGESDPAWSPDGSKLAFARPPTASSSDVDIFIINVDGTNLVDITNNPNSDRQPVWSPDGTKIVFTSLRNQSNNIYVMNANGSTQTKLDSLAGDSSPSWSPDGGKIIFSSLQNGNNDDIYIMNPDGSNLTKLIGTSLHDSFSSWQPMLAPTFAPTLIAANGSSRAIALDSVTFRRDPFTVSNNYNFGSDQRTRIMLFAVYADLLPGEDRTVVTAQAENAQHQITPLTVEYVGKHPIWAWLTQVNVKLPDELAGAGDVLVSITLHGTNSNKVQVTIQ
jgi:Tol biopolymer transport system component